MVTQDEKELDKLGLTHTQFILLATLARLSKSSIATDVEMQNIAIRTG